MKTIYYFLEWHWKKYKFDIVDLIPITGVSIVTAFTLGVLGYNLIAGFIIFSCLLAIIWTFIKYAIINPIRNSFREYKNEQRNLLTKINYGQEDYERFRRR